MADVLTEPSLSVGAGRVRGTIDQGVQAFLGIPYAAPPVGELRMRPPAPVPPWEEVLDATAYGPTAPKGDYPPHLAELFREVVIAGDACLNLNVWTPDASATGLPVLVWIHGGAFTQGSGSMPEYRGAAFARDGVVCVTVNYRLGAEGFLLTPDGVANLGLL